MIDRTGDYASIVRATMKASALLNQLPPRTTEAWELVHPFLSCTTCDGVTPHRANIAMAMLFATAGDCMRELGQGPQAADLYRRATQYPGFFGYCGFYATVVLDYGLSDHAEPAAMAIRRQRVWWSQRGWFYRGVCYGLWWLRYGLWRGDMRKKFREQKVIEEQLLQRVVSAKTS